jgi:flotillin
VQQATIDVAQQEKLGAIGVASAHREKAIEVANANKLREIGTRMATRDQAIRLAELDKEQKIGEQTASFERESQVKEAEQKMRVAVAEANARGVAGESAAQADVAAAQATLMVKKAEAYRLSETSKREAEAAVQEAQNRALARAALAEAERVEAEKRATLEAPAKAEKAKMIVDAEAAAERVRLEAEGQAKAIFARLEAEARGQYQILAKKAEGLQKIVEACGSSSQAFQMLMLEHLDKLAETSARAISGIKFDKVVVWENGGGNGHGSQTSNFLQNLARVMPPMMQVMKDIGGVEMPEYLAKLVPEGGPRAEVVEDENGRGVTPARNA